LLQCLDRLNKPLWWAPPAREGAADRPAGRTLAGDFGSAADPRLHDALRLACERGKCALVCGSHFLVAPVRAKLLGLSTLDIDAPELTDPVNRH
jgi:hypothetical protein